MPKIILSIEAQDFLWHSYFSGDYYEAVQSIDTALIVCAKRAYLDMCRTLRFNGNCSDKERSDFREEVYKLIVKNIRDKLFNFIETDFDTEHDAICDEIIKFCNNYPKDKEQKILKEEFYYGQAQKWINMTLKYMLLMGFAENELKPIANALHIPVDSYIMKKASDDFNIPKNSKVWSRWGKKEYIDFQEAVRSALKEKTPMEWESEAWLSAKKEQTE